MYYLLLTGEIKISNKIEKYNDFVNLLRKLTYINFIYNFVCDNIHILRKTGKESYNFNKEKFSDYVSEETIHIDDENVGSGEIEKLLSKFTTNMNMQVQKQKIDPVIGREIEIESIVLALGRRNKANVILVGDPGVGKTAIEIGRAHV